MRKQKLTLRQSKGIWKKKRRNAKKKKIEINKEKNIKKVGKK